MLSDAQIDRFSRQIILPQIGGAGQARLLQSSVALAGDGALAEIVALYLTGAGIGRIALHGGDHSTLRAALVDLDPDVQVTLHSGALGRAVDADLLVACDLALDELDLAVASRRPLIAGGVERDQGWMVGAESPRLCASCAARDPAAGGAIGEPQVVESQPSVLASAAAGVVGSLMALAALKLRLGLGEPARRVWVQFDPHHSTLVEHALVRAADCPACAAA